MNKKIKVIELLNLLAENEIEKGTRIKYNGTIYIVDFPNLCGIYPEGGTTRAEDSLFAKLDICALDYYVEILEDEEEIDIQSIEETEIKNKDGAEYYEYYNGGYTESGYTKNYSLDDLQSKKIINQLIKAVKQLDKKIKKED